MSDTVERLGTSEVKIQVRIPWSELEASYKDSLSKVRSTIQVRGFRPGKAPQAMIEKMVGERLVRDVAVDQVGLRVQELIKREDIMPLKVPIGIEDDLQIGEDREASFTARVEVLPMIDRIDFSGLTLEEKRKISDKDLRERIELIAARKAPLETAPEDHVVGEYDQVILEGKATFKDEEGAPQDVKDFRVDLAPWSEPPPGLAEQVRGGKAGDTGDVDLVLPGPGTQDQPRYAHLDYTISEVVTRRLPEIDDELAKDFDMESLEELEDMVRESLEKEAFDEYVARNGESILDQLVDRVEFDLPPSYSQGLPGQEEDDADEPEDEEAKKAKEQREKIAELYDRFSRRNVLSMLLAYQNKLRLPEETIGRASEEMRGYIDSQDGSKAEKEQAFEQWRREFEQGLFNRVLSSFLVQEVEKSQGKDATSGPDEGENAPGDGGKQEEPSEDKDTEES
jgi:trigger factor